MVYRHLRHILFIVAVFVSCGLGVVHYFKTEQDRLLCERSCKSAYGKSIVSAIAWSVDQNTIHCSCYPKKGFPISLYIRKNQKGCKPLEGIWKKR